MIIRFLIQFVLYGLLFYAIWVFFPDAFATLVSWASTLAGYLREVWIRIRELTGL
jgi:hypothetical protein